MQVNEPLPLVLAIIMGFQHAAAMVAGIVLGPLTITEQNPDPSITACELSVLCDSSVFTPNKEEWLKL